MEAPSIKPLVWCGVMISLLHSGACWRLALAQDAFPKPVANPPLPPPITSPGINLFRQLLAAQPEEREKLLAGKNAEHRKVIEAGVREYESLPPEARELRLRTMELRYQLTSLLRLAPSNRVDRLKLLPEKDRPLLEDRLKIWNELSPDEQKEQLENERAIRIMTSVAGSRAPVKDVSLSNQASNQVRRIEEQFVRWQSLPAGRREQLQRYFTNLFELTDAEKARERLPLTEPERALMEETLDRFKKLSPLQRAQCVRNFEKFAALSPVERRQFLVSAQEWQKMKPEDREAWRKLVSKVPPLPPLPGSRPPALPSAPRPPRSVSTAQATN